MNSNKEENKMIKILLFLLMISPTFSQGINVSGTVKGENGENISNAYVRLVSANMFDISDDNGNFEFIKGMNTSVNRNHLVLPDRTSYTSYNLLGRKVKGNLATAYYVHSEVNVKYFTPLYRSSVSIDTVQASAFGYESKNIPLDNYVTNMDITLSKVVVLNPPEPVILDKPQNVTENTMQMVWSISNETDFSSYKLYSSTSQNVTENSNLVVTVTDINDWWEPVSGLVKETTYYFKIYVVDTDGLSTGSNEIMVKTLGGVVIDPPDDTTIVVDPLVCSAGTNEMCDSRDYQKYRTITLGTQTWMAENLNFPANGSHCYNDDQDMCDIYGRLYEWELAKTSCPDGWHLPTQTEWKAFETYTDTYHIVPLSQSLRDESWGDGADQFGFSALPAGVYGNGFSSSLGFATNWWSSTPTGQTDWAYVAQLEEVNFIVNNAPGYTKTSVSVRCLKN